MKDYLKLNSEMELFGAIGKFHLADHVDGCFSKWSLNFMKGAGHIDGEIMETLWSGMNKVSGAARSMSKSHRQETLDDYMRDSNWKKIVGIGEFLINLRDSFCSLSFKFQPYLLNSKGLDSTQPSLEHLPSKKTSFGILEIG